MLLVRQAIIKHPHRHPCHIKDNKCEMSRVNDWEKKSSWTYAWYGRRCHSHQIHGDKGRPSYVTSNPEMIKYYMIKESQPLYEWCIVVCKRRKQLTLRWDVTTYTPSNLHVSSCIQESIVPVSIQSRSFKIFLILSAETSVQIKSSSCGLQYENHSDFNYCHCLCRMHLSCIDRTNK